MRPPLGVWWGRGARGMVTQGALSQCHLASDATGAIRVSKAGSRSCTTWIRWGSAGPGWPVLGVRGVEWGQIWVGKEGKGQWVGWFWEWGETSPRILGRILIILLSRLCYTGLLQSAPVISWHAVAGALLGIQHWPAWAVGRRGFGCYWPFWDKYLAEVKHTFLQYSEVWRVFYQRPFSVPLNLWRRGSFHSAFKYN